jgi:hypothetical protein
VTEAAPTRLGLRPLAGATVELDPTLIAATLRTSGRYDYRWLAKRPDAVSLEVLRRDPELVDHWHSRCRTCGTDEAHVERPGVLWCCSAIKRVTRVAAGWAWTGDVDWTIERAKAEGALADDPKKLWPRFPLACLFGRAIREAWKLHAPDALPIGLVEVFPPDEGRERAVERSIEERAARQNRTRGMPKREAEATRALIDALHDLPPTTVELGDEEREEEERQDAEAARITAAIAADGPTQPDPDWVGDPIPPTAVVEAGGGSNAPRADGPHPSASAPGAGKE